MVRCLLGGIETDLKQVKCLLSLAHVSYKNFNFRGKGYIEKHAYLLHTQSINKTVYFLNSLLKNNIYSPE